MIIRMPHDRREWPPGIFAFTGIHFVAIYSLDVRDRDSARHIFGDLVGTVHLNRLLLAAAGRAIEVNRPYLKNGKQS